MIERSSYPDQVYLAKNWLLHHTLFITRWVRLDPAIRKSVSAPAIKCILLGLFADNNSAGNSRLQGTQGRSCNRIDHLPVFGYGEPPLAGSYLP